MSTEDSLEYEIIQEPFSGDFQVWTPDECGGACIGSGATREEAVRNAMHLMAGAIAKLDQEIA